MAGAAQHATQHASTAGLEPGLHRVLRLLTVLHAVSAPLIRRSINAAVGIDQPLFPLLLLTLPVPLLLVALVWIPSWEGRRSRVLLPATLGIAAVNLLADKFLALWMLNTPGAQELHGVMLLVRLWFPFHVITVIIAWQYRWRVAVAIAVLLATADFALSRPFNRPGGTLHPLFLFISVARLWSIALIAMGVGWWRHRQEEQEAFSRRLIDSQEGERKRIAAELHDGLGQSLLVIKNRALVGGMSLDGAATSKEQFEEISLAASQAIEETRRIAYDLRPYHLDRLGLEQSLEEMVERVAAATSIRFDANIPLLDGVFTKEEEAIFYRIVQESISNIVKHAQATEAVVAIHREEESITLTVRDNGRGFSTPQRQDSPSGFGLIGLAERVRMLAGVYTLETVPNQGTTITVKVPVMA